VKSKKKTVDFIKEERKVWDINPVTRIKKNELKDKKKRRVKDKKNN
jgi:hypothetical protein